MFGNLEDELTAANELSGLTGVSWVWDHTGGGCTALVHVLGVDHYFMITHAEGASVPCANDPVCVGEYVNDEAVNYWYFDNRTKAADFIVTWGSNRGAV